MTDPPFLIICLVQKVHYRVSTVSAPTHESVLWSYKFIPAPQNPQIFQPTTKLELLLMLTCYWGIGIPFKANNPRSSHLQLVWGDAVEDSLFGRTSCLFQWRWGAMASRAATVFSGEGKLCRRRNVNESKNTLRGGKMVEPRIKRWNFGSNIQFIGFIVPPRPHEVTHKPPAPWLDFTWCIFVHFHRSLTLSDRSYRQN